MSVVWRAREACCAARPGKLMVAAGGVAATFIHTTLIHMRRPAPLRSFSSHLFSYGAPLTALVANSLFATSCVGTGAAMMISRLLGKARVRSPIAGPVGSAMIKWPAGIIVGPVCAKDEGRDRHINHVDIVRKVNVPVPIVVLEIARRNPAAIAGEAYIAPRITAQAAMNVDMGTARDLIDHGKSRSRASSHVHRAGDNAPRRQCGGRRC